MEIKSIYCAQNNYYIKILQCFSCSGKTGVFDYQMGNNINNSSPFINLSPTLKAQRGQILFMALNSLQNGT